MVRRQRWVYRIEPSRFPPDFPERLERFMEAAELSSRGLARLLRVDNRMLRRWRKGTQPDPGHLFCPVQPRRRDGPASHPVARGGRPGGCRAQNRLTLSGLGETASGKPGGPFAGIATLGRPRDSSPPALRVFSIGLPASTSPPRRGAAALFPEEDHVPLAVHDEALAKQLSRRTEATTDGSRGFAFVRDELAGLAGFDLSDLVHVLAYHHATLSGQG